MSKLQHAKYMTLEGILQRVTAVRHSNAHASQQCARRSDAWLALVSRSKDHEAEKHS
jgi:hypothetical protein